LYIYSHGILYVYYSLSQLTHLHTLDVSRSKLGTLPEVIPKMESLTKLRLMGCDLHALPDRQDTLVIYCLLLCKHIKYHT